ncbi:hypothetical protein [Burkholderia vietnamiensis]|uniref:hypothetical protein n=1 Tax=Burkholderia vietnamiensis TaxID=60552 RepID=UPI0012D981BA|nr:hypothetical protein [Burkholderia vietnamiensis]
MLAVARLADGIDTRPRRHPSPPLFLRRKTVRPRWMFERQLDAPRAASIGFVDRPALKPKTDHLSTHIVSNSKVVTGASQCSGAEPVDTLTRYCRRRERADCRYAAG